MNRKKLLTVAVASLLMLAVPSKAANMVFFEMGVAEQMEEQVPTLSVEGSTVNVKDASGMTLEVVSLTGRAVASYKIEGPAQRVELNLPKGCYILKVGKVVRKITVR